MNKYGYFKYLDFPQGAQESAGFSTADSLQEVSSPSLLGMGVKPYKFASLEHNAYVTRNPAPLYKGEENLCYLSTDVSDQSGNFPYEMCIEANFPEYYSMTGITIRSRNIIKNMTIAAYKDGSMVNTKIFSASDYEQFYPIEIDGANKIEIIIRSINEPGHFLGIYEIKFGRIRIFGDNQNVSAEMTNNFSVLGDTIEYDTLDLSVINIEGTDGYIFQKKQPVYFVKDEQEKFRFYIESGDNTDEKVLNIIAYDDIANLEETFFGGIYNKKSVGVLIDEILGDAVDHKMEIPQQIYVSGYIPVCTKRKALQMALLASNLRCYKGKQLVFKALEYDIREEKLTSENILENPKVSEKTPLRSFVAIEHNYSKGSERSELYHWYMSKTQPVTLTFSAPFHSLKAYEVIGEDENGIDIISETESTAVSFLEVGSNYCIVSNTSDNKIVITGANYVDSTTKHERKNNEISRGSAFVDVEVDLTLHGDTDEVCDVLFPLYTKKHTMEFLTLVDVEPGGYYNILGNPMYIKRKRQTLNGVYEVEAV